MKIHKLCKTEKLEKSISHNGDVRESPKRIIMFIRRGFLLLVKEISNQFDCFRYPKQTVMSII